MLLHVPEVLEPDEVRRLRALLAESEWVDGRVTAGTQSAQTKNNRQVPDGSPAAIAGGDIVLAGLQRSALFFTAALPKKIVPPLFNRYDGAANAFGGGHAHRSERRMRERGDCRCASSRNPQPERRRDQGTDERQSVSLWRLRRYCRGDSSARARCLTRESSCSRSTTCVLLM